MTLKEKCLQALMFLWYVLTPSWMVRRGRPQLGDGRHVMFYIEEKRGV